MVAWEPPGDADWCKRERPRIQAVKGELERGLMPPTASHVQWCVNKLFALPTRDGTATTAALQADNFIDACGHFPDDLWTWATTELLKTSTFRPSPAEMVKLVEPKYAERQRMLERVKQMLNGTQPKAIAAPAQETTTRLERMQTTAALYRKHGRIVDAERVERLIAQEINPGAGAGSSQSLGPAEAPAPSGPYQPADTPTNRRLAELAAAKREGRQPAEYRDVAEA